MKFKPFEPKMSLSNHKKMPFNNFPEELLSEVFKRLPVKYVLRCGAVQQSWYNLIKSSMFISEYQKTATHINPKYLLIYDLNYDLMIVCSDDAQFQEYGSFEYHCDLPLTSWYAHSNGLICVSTVFDSPDDFNPGIYLWNPLLEKIMKIPSSPLLRVSFKETKWVALAFGFLPEVNDYVAVHMVKPCSTSAPDNEAYELYPHSVMISVFSLNTNSWKEIGQDKVFVDQVCSDLTVFVNGTAFWVGYNSNELYQLVMCFDTKTNILRTIKVPDWTQTREGRMEPFDILPFKNSIAYFVEVYQEDVDEDDDDYGSRHLDMWVLKDNMIGEFPWEKKISFGPSENVWKQVLGLRNNGELILAKPPNTLISYDLNTHEPYDFVESVDRLTPYASRYDGELPFVISPFVGTLVLHDID